MKRSGHQVVVSISLPLDLVESIQDARGGKDGRSCKTINVSAICRKALERALGTLPHKHEPRYAFSAPDLSYEICSCGKIRVVGKVRKSGLWT